MFTSFKLEMKSLVLSTVYSDLVSGDNSFARYLDVLYVAVPMFEIIGRIGSAYVQRKKLSHLS